jgi:putative hydrolase
MNPGGIIDFHTHTFFSDGDLSPAESVRRAEHAGYSVIALTDHADASNLEPVLEAMTRFVRDTQPYLSIAVIPGVELTHIPPGQIAPLVRRARSLGAEIVLLHGETVAEPVKEGTNRAGIEGGIDILTHPGLMSEEDAFSAAKRGVYLEITGRPAHALTNGHVAGLAKRTGASLVLNSDLHSPGEYLSAAGREEIARGAGLTEGDLSTIIKNMNSLALKLRGGRKIV